MRPFPTPTEITNAMVDACSRLQPRGETHSTLDPSSDHRQEFVPRIPKSSSTFGKGGEAMAYSGVTIASGTGAFLLVRRQEMARLRLSETLYSNEVMEPNHSH